MSSKIQSILESRPDLRQHLFVRGFLISKKRIASLSAFPFYGNWSEREFGGCWFYWHQLTRVCFQESNGVHSFLLGHCYDPFRMESEEAPILRSMNETCGTDAFYERLNEITGVYVLGLICDGVLRFYVDPSGMQSACYCAQGEDFLLSSHPQLIGDLKGFRMAPLVQELTQYKWYGRVMGPYLPGDLTPFQEVKRIVPNIEYSYSSADRSISHRRFWPLNPLQEAVGEKDYQQVIQDGAEILRRNMELVARKFQHPWISLTGGIDSNTTFAAANGHYDRFETFSYISAEKEIQDAAAAKRIAEHFGLRHHEIPIPKSNDALPDYAEIRAILMHNNGYIAETKDNEIRKRIVLREKTQCDVEVKSWVSETIRAYWYKHYGRKTMPALSPKLFRNLYKIFLANRGLAHKIDRIFDDYIERFEYRSIPSCYPPADMHFNEVTWGSWGGLNISEMKYCFDITFIYNNRRFFEHMFRVPLEKRISDQHHLDMKRILNPELADMNIRIVNLKETRFRAFALNVIFVLNRILP